MGPALRRQLRGPRPPARGWDEKGGGDQALGRSRGGFSTKLHLRAERGGKPLAVALTGGERHELPLLPALLLGGAVKRRGPGRPRWRPEAVVGEKGFSSPGARLCLRAHGVRRVIPTRSDQPNDPGFDRTADRERHVGERTISRCKQLRAVATRYDKFAAAHVTLASIIP